MTRLFVRVSAVARLATTVGFADAALAAGNGKHRRRQSSRLARAHAARQPDLLSKRWRHGMLFERNRFNHAVSTPVSNKLANTCGLGDLQIAGKILSQGK